MTFWTRIETPHDVSGVDWLDSLHFEGLERSFGAVVHSGAGGGETMLSLKIPTLGFADFPPGQGRIIELTLKTAVFQTLTEFPSWLWGDAESNGVKQRADAGDASQRVPSNSLKVIATGTASPGVRMVELTPNPFSPNNDGINDLADFHVQAVSLLGQGQLQLQVHSLSGRALHRAVTDPATAGEAILTWDGRDGSGKLCVPGIYFYRISLHTEQRELAQSAVGTIVLAD